MRVLRIVAVNLLVFLFLFLCVEISFRLMNPHYRYYEQTYPEKFEASRDIKAIDSNWVQVSEDFGWVCKKKPYLQFYLPEYAGIFYEINDQGFRNGLSFSSLPVNRDKDRILLIGDSFLFGIFLPDSLTISSRLQKLVGENAEVLNISIPAWGLDQMYLAYCEYVDRLQPDQVIILCIDDDIARLAEAFYWGVGLKPAFRLEEGQLVEKESTDGKLNFLQNYFYFNSKVINHLYHQLCLRKTTPLAAVFFDRWIREESKRGRRLSVLRFPRIAQIEEQSRTVPFDGNQFFAGKEARFIDMANYLKQKGSSRYSRYYIPGDGHPSAEGAEEIAAFIYRYLLSEEESF